MWPGKGRCHAGSGLGHAPSSITSCNVGKVLRCFCSSIPGHPNPSKGGLDGALSNLIQWMVSLAKAGGLNWMCLRSPPAQRFCDSMKRLRTRCMPRGAVPHWGRVRAEMCSSRKVSAALAGQHQQLNLNTSLGAELKLPHYHL